MTNKKLSPAQVKLKKVLQPIVEGILKEYESDLPPSVETKKIGNVIVEINENEDVQLRVGNRTFEMQGDLAIEVCRYIISVLK